MFLENSTILNFLCSDIFSESSQNFPPRRNSFPYIRFLLQVRCNNGSETEVPGVILVIPPPDKKAVQQVQRSANILFLLSNHALKMVIEIKNRIKKMRN